MDLDTKINPAGENWLGDVLTRDDILSNSNTLILAPCGSGKTYFIFNQLIQPTDEVLVLCDNTNLKESLQPECNAVNMFDNVHIMTYSAFGAYMDSADVDQELIKYDYIVCDEAHNILDYEKMKAYKVKDGVHNLNVAKNILFFKQCVPIVMFTGTPYSIKLEMDLNKDKGFGKNIVIKDYIEEYIVPDKRRYKVKRYTGYRNIKVTHISQLRQEIQAYKVMFQEFKGKALMFGTTFEIMDKLQELCDGLELKAIQIWSTNADKPMTEEQLAVRDSIINKGILPDKGGVIKEDYDVLIINRAMETGINIKDYRFNLFVGYCGNLTYSYQARGRLRMNLDTIIFKDNAKGISDNMRCYVPDTFLNTPLTMNVMEALIKYLDIHDGDGRLIGKRKLITLLENNNYNIERKRITIQGTKYSTITITKK